MKALARRLRPLLERLQRFLVLVALSASAARCGSTDSGVRFEFANQGTIAVSGTGGTLQVNSQGSYTDVGHVCTTDCGALVARCQTPPLAVGTTTFQHGTTTLSLTVPFTGDPPCAGTL